MYKLVKSFLQDESGATAIEYGLIAGLVSVAAIGALTLMGGLVSDHCSTASGSARVRMKLHGRFRSAG